MALPRPEDPTVDRERVRGYFGDPGAYDYTRFGSPAGRRRAAWAARCFRALLPASGGGRVLEVGAGTGRFTRLVTQAGLDVTAVDLSAPMVAFLARHFGRRGGCRVLRADAFALPFGEGAFDGAVCMSLIGRFADSDNQAAVLRELCRVVRPGGWMLFNDRNPRSVFSRRRGKGGLGERDLVERGPSLGFAIDACRGLHVVSGGFVRSLPAALARVVVWLDRMAVALPGVPPHNVLYRARRVVASGAGADADRGS